MKSKAKNLGNSISKLNLIEAVGQTVYKSAIKHFHS